MHDIGIGLLGLGTVGGGVADLLLRDADRLAARAGVRPVLRRIAERNPDAGADLKLDRRIVTPNPMDVIADPKVDVVVELIGGTTVAHELVMAALRAGKPVVTANKALLAHHGRAIMAESQARGVPVYFEASVGGGIPVLRAIREGLIADRIQSVMGIVNGTCNYILTRMESRHCAYEEALADARAQGYAEADPSLDVDGWDSAHKTIILAALAFGWWLPLENVTRYGIARFSPRDLELAAAIGRRVKLLSILRRTDAGIELSVEPCLVSDIGPLGTVSGVFNAVWVRGAPVGDTLYCGRGAGRDATSSAVVGDILEASVRRASGGGMPLGMIPCADAPPPVVPATEHVSAYGLRVSFPDFRAGERTEAALQILQKHGLQTSEVHALRWADGEGSSLVLLCRPTRSQSAAAAAADLRGLPGADPVVNRLRMEEI